MKYLLNWGFNYWNAWFLNDHFYYDELENTIDLFFCALYLQVMTHAAYIYDIQHVVIDNLQFMLGSGVRLVYYFTSHAVICIHMV